MGTDYSLEDLEYHDAISSDPRKTRKKGYRPVSTLMQETGGPTESISPNAVDMLQFALHGPLIRPRDDELEDPPPPSTLNTYRQIRGPELRRLGRDREHRKYPTPVSSIAVPIGIPLPVHRDETGPSQSYHPIAQSFSYSSSHPLPAIPPEGSPRLQPISIPPPTPPSPSLKPKHMISLPDRSMPEKMPGSSYRADTHTHAHAHAHAHTQLENSNPLPTPPTPHICDFCPPPGSNPQGTGNSKETGETHSSIDDYEFYDFDEVWEHRRE